MRSDIEEARPFARNDNRVVQKLDEHHFVDLHKAILVCRVFKHTFVIDTREENIVLLVS